MALTYCETCGELEGATRQEDEEIVCAECGEIVELIPEHDDYDMDR